MGTDDNVKDISKYIFVYTTQFYLTLPRNSSLEYFPNNTVANFKVELAEPVELTGVVRN